MSNGSNDPNVWSTGGKAYMERYYKKKDLQDLNQAVYSLSRALELTPDQSSHRPFLCQRRIDLAIAFTHRFRRLGDIPDLDRAIQLQSVALELTKALRPPGNPFSAFRDLGILYNLRFRRLGDPGDIDKAIDFKNRALGLVGRDDRKTSSQQYSSLAASYADRARYLKTPADLDQAIIYQTKALEQTHPSHQDHAFRLANFGVFYNDRYRLQGDPGDLTTAIDSKLNAVNNTPQNHPDLPRRCISLAASYTDRYLLEKWPADLKAAYKNEDRAVELTPDGHKDMAQWLCNQAETFLLRHKYAKHTDPRAAASNDFRRKAYNCFRSASTSQTAAPRDKFQFALRWAGYAREIQGDPLNTLEAYQTALDLFPQFVWLGATTSQRYQDLSSAENLGASGAYAAIQHQDFGLALEFLENTRGVVWNQLRMLRSPLDELEQSYPELGRRLRDLSRELHDNISDEPESQLPDSDPVKLDKAAQERRRLATTYNDLLNMARNQPGFENFLRPLKSTTLVHAARYGPVVVLTCREDGSDALIIRPGVSGVGHVPLPRYKKKMAKQARYELDRHARHRDYLERHILTSGGLRRGATDLENVLGDLWDRVVHPVLQSLGFLPIGANGTLPHITWCPTGVMSFLPLHAAGDYRRSQPGHRVFECAVSSYTPTLAALFAPSPKRLGSGGILAIGQENTPGHSSLPGTVQELASIRNRTPRSIKCTQLAARQATRDIVLNELGKHDWVHFACHAHQDLSDPLGSEFFLHDKGLGLASINRRCFKDKGLAFLSACQTATGDKDQPDEALHLASGMLMAGYPSVIATMWSIADGDAPLVADRVYGALMGNGELGNGQAGRALHYAVAELRRSIGEQEFMRWVPYIHMGL